MGDTLVAEMVVRNQQEQEGFLHTEKSMKSMGKMPISQGVRICPSKCESLVHTPN